MTAFPESRIGAFSRHLFIDAAKRADGHALVVRGEDNRLGVLPGRGDPPMAWNEIDGRARTHDLATGTLSEVGGLMDALVEFYASKQPISVRMRAYIDAGHSLEALAVMLAVFPCNQYQRDNPSRRRVGSYSRRNLSRLTGGLAV